MFLSSGSTPRPVYTNTSHNDQRDVNVPFIRQHTKTGLYKYITQRSEGRQCFFHQAAHQERSIQIHHTTITETLMFLSSGSTPRPVYTNTSHND